MYNDIYTFRGVKKPLAIVRYIFTRRNRDENEKVRRILAYDNIFMTCSNSLVR